jgi:competence protein ComEA
VDINKAGVEELCTIPGIGEARATAIIEYRESSGGFKEIEELKNISGIKDATFNKIKPYVCVR